MKSISENSKDKQELNGERNSNSPQLSGSSSSIIDNKTKSQLEENSTCCNNDFQWMNGPHQSLYQTPGAGSLDRHRRPHQNRQERDCKSKSYRSRGRSPESSRQFHFPPPPPVHYPNHYGLDQQQWYKPQPHNDVCCNYHTLPSCCGYYGYYPSGDMFPWRHKSPLLQPRDERVQQLQQEKENLQMQVSVLAEQIEAQTHTIHELGKQLTEKKEILNNAENHLQREMLSRSSMETHKLELMSAMTELKLQLAALERENYELRTINASYTRKPPFSPSRTSPLPEIRIQTSTPNLQVVSSHRRSLSPGPISVGVKMDPVRHSRTPSSPAYNRYFGSLPRENFVNSNAELGSGSIVKPSLKGRVHHSVPNLAETENSSPDCNSSPKSSKDSKTKVTKMKRSGSENLYQRGPKLIQSDFQRPLPQLCYESKQRPDKPFTEWNSQNICDWFHEIGLEMYINDWLRKNGDGAVLVQNPQVFVKELGIKNPLHRKKLHLAVKAEGEVGDPFLVASGKLDTNWVLQWLDDIGLPQHKDAFLQARVDGRMLYYLSWEDVGMLHVTSLLHATCLKRGIQLLKECNFESDCLIRRSLPDEQRQWPPSEVALWTVHRVMEWLCSCDLSEYAPNLRGAGVHGALMVFETKFTDELLAVLLNIPPSKTLLRRHLSTQFTELLGRDIIQQKREVEIVLGNVPLTPVTKVKVSKKSQFSLLRKKNRDFDFGELICPLETATSPHSDEKEEEKSRKGTGCLSTG